MLRRLVPFLLISTAASAQTAVNPWAAMAQADIDFTASYMRQQSIAAVYPAPAAFEQQLVASRQAVSAEIAQVTNYEGYRQVLKHYLGTFADMHVYATPTLVATTYQWPGFIAAYRGHRYVTAASTGSIANDQEISACDGQPLPGLVARVATYEGYIPGLESTKASAAALLFRDAGSPFITRPASCIIGGKSVQLAWQTAPTAAFNAAVDKTRFPTDNVFAITPFGTNGAWVRMGRFYMTTQAEGAAFHKLIDDAPRLRDKSVIVLDVRANGGGPYEWMMGFIRALYGADYANYYARARLDIAGAYRVTPAILAYNRGNTAATTGALVPPPDGTPYDPDDVLYEKALQSGEPVFHIPKNSKKVPMPAPAPASVVKAKVYVLTDYRCGSVCIGFLDEMKRLPGVTQIGVETFIDSRTGSPMPANLPSNMGSVSVPTMTRDGRARGDNIPQKPDIEFMGNIADTEAVKAWISTLARQAPQHDTAKR